MVHLQHHGCEIDVPILSFDNRALVGFAHGPAKLRRKRRSIVNRKENAPRCRPIGSGGHLA